jgi:hypothetical protein
MGRNLRPSRQRLPNIDLHCVVIPDTGDSDADNLTQLTEFPKRGLLGGSGTG